jgi:hypothetical protein
VIARPKPFKILEGPLGKGKLKEAKSINERRNILTTWAKLIIEKLGKETMLLLEKPYQGKRPYDQILRAGSYMFHAFPGSKATLDGGLKPMSFANGALLVKLDGQCWFDASLMGALEHVHDNHMSAIAGKGGVSIAMIGPGAHDNYYAHLASK